MSRQEMLTRSGGVLAAGAAAGPRGSQAALAAPASGTRAALVAVALAGAGAALLAACGTPTRQAAADAGTEVITVKATEFAFSPSTVRVPAGRPVRVVLDNAGVIEHDFTVVRLPASGVRAGGRTRGRVDEVAAYAAAGKQAWVEFTPTENGTYDVECTVPGHKDAGMKGKLVVE